MQQYDLQGSSFGCKNSMINMEARSIDSKVLTRRCAVGRLTEVTVPKYRDMASQGAGGLLVLLPRQLAELSPDDKQHLQSLERELAAEASSVPVYFATESEFLQSIHSDLQSAGAGDSAPTAWEALVSSATANGFQLVVAGTAADAQPDFEIVNLEGHLSGYGIEEQLPTIVVAAHYDAMGIAPSLSFGVDSNGSGIIILLELARLFSKLYTNSRTHAKYNLVFLLSGGGKFNYQGSKRWIEDNFEAAESSVLSDVALVLCLDSLGRNPSLNMHVSKPPRPESAGGLFYKNLQAAGAAVEPEVPVAMVHKKINLAEETLAWEHERFSIKRLAAATLSHFPGPKAPQRQSIMDTREGVDAAVLARNAQVVAEALARQVYNLTSHGDFQMFSDNLRVSEAAVASWLDYLASVPRAQQLLPPSAELLSSLEAALGQSLKDVRRTAIKADKRDPEFQFYSGSEYTMSAYNVKPAVFDLFLALFIGGYLALAYFVAQNFNVIYQALKTSVKPSSPKAKAH